MRFLLVDRIVELSSSSLVRGVKHVTRDDPYLCRDEAGRFCFIPSLMGEALGQLAAWKVMAETDFQKRPVAGVVSSACLLRPAYVGETLLLESFIDQLDEAAVQYHSIAKIGEETVFTIDGALGPLLPMGEFIAEEQVRQQFNEVNRPGEWASYADLAGLDEESDLTPTVTAAVMRYDRILHLEPGVSLTAEKRITRAAPYFPDHFPNKPVLPMSVLLECKLNLAREFVARSAFNFPYQIHQLRRIKMSDFIYPGDVVVSKLQVKSQDATSLTLTYRTEVGGKRICVLDLIFKA